VKHSNGSKALSSALLAMVLSAALSGCISTPETPPEYHQGVYRPATPVLRPGVGAPTYDPHVAPQREPQPKPSRLLPETPETRRQPGIWASDAPEAKIAFDWNVPLPENDEEAAKRIKRCAESMKTASARGLHVYEIKAFDRININWRKCWPHAAIVRCLDGLKQEASASTERDTLQRARDFAQAAMADACSGGAGMWSPGFVQALERTWGAR
jgi:hypothetical protein